MATPNNSALRPPVDCKINHRGLNPGYKKYNVNDMVTLTIEIARDEKSHQLPIQEDHLLGVAIWIECQRQRVSIFESFGKSLKEFDGGQEGKIKIPQFRLLPFKTPSLQHHLVVKVTPKGHESFSKRFSIDWDRDKFVPWARHEITETAQEAYNDNQRYMLKIDDIIEKSKVWLRKIDFDNGKDEKFQYFMRKLQKNVELTMVKIEQLQGKTAIRTYTDVPMGKTVKPVFSQFLSTKLIFDTKTEFPPPCLEIGSDIALIIYIKFDGTHPRGPVSKIRAKLIHKPEKDASENGNIMYQYHLGEYEIWFNDKSRRKGMLVSNGPNDILITDPENKLKTGHYYFEIAVDSPGWEMGIRSTSKPFILKVSEGSGEGEPSP